MKNKIIISLALISIITSGCSSSHDGEVRTDVTPLGLHVSVTGAGAGTVTSDIGGINCKKTAGICDATFDPGSHVTLTAVPDPGYVFKGWLGGSCQGAQTCQVTVSAATSIKAAFVLIVFFFEYESRSGSKKYKREYSF